MNSSGKISKIFPEECTCVDCSQVLGNEIKHITFSRLCIYAMLNFFTGARTSYVYKKNTNIQ